MKDKTRNGLSFREFLSEELKDPEIRRRYENAAVEWLVARKVSQARKRAHLSQAELARRLRTKQQAVSRTESGEQNATVKLLCRIAKALGMRFEFGFRSTR